MAVTLVVAIARRAGVILLLPDTIVYVEGKRQQVGCHWPVSVYATPNVHRFDADGLRVLVAPSRFSPAIFLSLAVRFRPVFDGSGIFSGEGDARQVRQSRRRVLR